MPFLILKRLGDNEPAHIPGQLVERGADFDKFGLHTATVFRKPGGGLVFSIRFHRHNLQYSCP
jgi:hypothetical protein